METIKKYTAIELNTNIINNQFIIDLRYGRIKGPYYDQTYPEMEFDSEEKAIEYAHKENKYGRWLILPVVRFVY